MVAIGRRMNKLTARLLNLRVGPGAAILPSDVTRIHMEFAKQWNDGQYGPRKFWRLCLPRLKYWNPAVPMIVNRTTEPTGPATMTIYFRAKEAAAAAAAAAASESAVSALTITPDVQPSSSFLGSSPAPPPTPAERTVQIDLKGLHSDAILRAFLDQTGAVPVAPTPQEAASLRELAARIERAREDSAAGRARNEARKREEAFLAQVRGEAAAVKQSAT